jgi:hypothetical protein
LRLLLRKKKNNRKGKKGFSNILQGEVFFMEVQTVQMFHCPSGELGVRSMNISGRYAPSTECQTADILVSKCQN